MCTFLNTLPRKSKSAGTAQKKSLVLSIKPCPPDPTTGEKTWYRFRLLNFASKTTDRDYPFIERFVHQHWKTNDKGFPEIEDEVTCPVTKWVEWEGNRYDGCPMCRYANQQFIALKESNWKDADARKKNREFGRKYQAIIPVYVINDPNYEGNNGKFRVIIFNDKKFYSEFIKKVEAQLMKANCFNGENAVDCCIHMSEVPEVRNEGQPNEYVYKNKVIDKIVFSKTPKTIAAITKEAVDAFPFDETYYVTSTKDELQAFYNKYIKVSNDDIVEDEDEIQVFSSPKKSAPAAVKTNKVVDTPVQNNISDNDDITDDDLDELTADAGGKSDSDSDELEDLEEPAPATDAKKTSTDDVLDDAELKELLDM